MTSFSNMSLYALTVKHPSATQDAISGDFIGDGKNKTQILSANGSRLTLLNVVRTQTRLTAFEELVSQDTFGIIRRLAKFRIAGDTKDYIVLSTDSGRLVTYEYLPEEKRLKIVHFETYGKSGIRRVVPGEYLAADPKGRAIMVAAPEKNKLVYILTRTGEREIAISSPLEAHKANSLLFALIGLDVGYDNPMFASLEVDYSASDNDPTDFSYNNIQKELVFYELDLGLNHIVRKRTEVVDRTAHMLFRVPGGPKMPSGVLVCAEDSITYHSVSASGVAKHRLAIPRREGATEDPNRKRIIVSGTLYTLKGGDFFYLLQTDDGDLFRVMIVLDNGVLQHISIKYYDTIPIATSICIMKTGFVFVATEAGDRMLYELESLGDESDDPLFDSTQFPVDPKEPFAPPFFKPRPLTNLAMIETTPSLNPILGMEVANPAFEDASQIYTINGVGGRSTFRTTRNALQVLDLVESKLPQEASAVWTSKVNADDDVDSLIVLCLHSRTLVLRIGEEVEEASNTGFLLETNTLGVQQFGDDAIIQVHPKGIRHIQGMHFPNEENENIAAHVRLTDWPVPPHRTIVACAANNRQVAIALSSGQILYFECDSDGSLAMSDEDVTLDSTINCLAIPEVPEGQLRAFYLAVGCSDQTVRIFNVSPDMEGNILSSVSIQALTSPPTDLTINNMTDKSPHGRSQYLHIGLQSGIYIRSTLDEMTGDIGDTRRRFLGAAPIKFAKAMVENEDAVLAMTTRPWLSYTQPRTSALELTPLSYLPFKSASSFRGRQLKGVVCVNGTELRIFNITDLHENTTYESIPLKYTPRKMVGYHALGVFYVIESDAHTMNTDARQKLIEGVDAHTGTEEANGAVTNGHARGEELPAATFGYPRVPGRWASCIQVIDPVHGKEVTHTVELDTNQSLTSVALVFFESQGDDAFLTVGCVRDLTHIPTTYKNASIQVYKISPDGRQLEFLHETDVPEPPTAMVAFKGKLLVGVGRSLCFYDCGKRSLLRKAQAVDCVPTSIVQLKSQGSRIVVADSQQSVTYVVHKDQIHPNRLIPFIDDQVARHTTAIEMVDYETTVGGDKFGNLWLVRCPPKASEGADESLDGDDLTGIKAFLNGAPERLDIMAHYYVNDIPVSIQKTGLVAGGDQVTLWAGIQGTLGALIPFRSRRQHKMFQQLELQLRIDDPPLSGRDHLAYRSQYNPVKLVIDGDLIERYMVLSQDKRESIAAQITGDWTVATIDEAIWNMRGLYAF